MKIELDELEARARAATPGPWRVHEDGQFPARKMFEVAWDAINGRRAGCSWRDNPWCWVLEFRRVEGT